MIFHMILRRGDCNDEEQRYESLGQEWDEVHDCIPTTKYTRIITAEEVRPGELMNSKCLKKRIAAEVHRARINFSINVTFSAPNAQHLLKCVNCNKNKFIKFFSATPKSAHR